MLGKIRRRESEGYGTFVRGACSFRQVERLCRAGLLAARITKWEMFRPTGYPFRELEVATRNTGGMRPQIVIRLEWPEGSRP